MQPYTVEWWSRVVEAWNSSPTSSHLAGIGYVSFEVLGSDQPIVTVCWDSAGIGSIAPELSDAPVRLAATAAHWRAFIDGEFTAVMGVLSRRIQLTGNPVLVLPYTSAFNRLAQLSRDA
jgi:hypothetical protein